MRRPMKSIVYALVLVLVIGILPAAVAHSTETATLVTTKYASRVRSGPGTNYAQIALLPANTTVPLKGRNAATSWLYVEYAPGSLGWLAAWLVTANGDLSGVPVVVPGAPTPPPTPPDGTITGKTRTSVNLRPEPNTNKPPIGVIPGGATIQVTGRNAAATWLFVTYQGKQGWVYAALVTLSGGTVWDLPVVPATPPPPPPPGPGFGAYVYNITYRSQQIFQDGRAKGNRADVFSKAGDSITASWAFLNKIGDGIYNLQDYGYLQPVVTIFSGTTARTGNSFNNVTVAAVEGWTSFDLLDPKHVEGICPGLATLACEYSLVRPSMGIIMIGTNDCSRGVDRGAYAANMAQIVELSIQYGVIPVLSTIPHNAECDAPAYNAIIIQTANTYSTPWMDFYAATVNLPNYGNDPDGVHPSVPPSNDPTNFTAGNLNYGFTVRNLLALHMLDAMWRQVLSQ